MRTGVESSHPGAAFGKRWSDTPSGRRFPALGVEEALDRGLQLPGIRCFPAILLVGDTLHADMVLSDRVEDVHAVASAEGANDREVVIGDAIYVQKVLGESAGDHGQQQAGFT